VLLIDGYGKRLSIENGMFKVESRDGRSAVRVNPVDIEDIVIVGGGVSITTRAISTAASCGIGIYIVDGRGRPPVVVGPVYSIKTVAARRGQYEARGSRLGAELAAELVRGKIENQARVLQLLNRYRDDSTVGEAARGLRARAGELELVGCGEGWESRLRHVEAEAARLYWSSLSTLLPRELGFDGRDHESGDPVNTSLNYLYALLYAKAYFRLAHAGLDPYAGLFHVDRSGRESLVYDFTEPLKPLLDYHLARELLSGRVEIRVEGGLLTEEPRRALLLLFQKALSSRVRVPGRPSTSFDDAIVSLAYLLARMLRERRVERGAFVLEWG